MNAECRDGMDVERFVDVTLHGRQRAIVNTQVGVYSLDCARIMGLPGTAGLGMGYGEGSDVTKNNMPGAALSRSPSVARRAQNRSVDNREAASWPDGESQ